MKLADFSSAALFGNFIGDSDKERHEIFNVSQTTVSLWSFINTNASLFINNLYEVVATTGTDNPMAASLAQRQLGGNRVRFWGNYYFRWARMKHHQREQLTSRSSIDDVDFHWGGEMILENVEDLTLAACYSLPYAFQKSLGGAHLGKTSAGNDRRSRKILYPQTEENLQMLSMGQKRRSRGIIRNNTENHKEKEREKEKEKEKEKEEERNNHDFHEEKENDKEREKHKRKKTKDKQPAGSSSRMSSSSHEVRTRSITTDNHELAHSWDTFSSSPDATSSSSSFVSSTRKEKEKTSSSRASRSSSTGRHKRKNSKTKSPRPVSAPSPSSSSLSSSRGLRQSGQGHSRHDRKRTTSSSSKSSHRRGSLEGREQPKVQNDREAKDY